ncbi:bifunctional epoxide hydrolase 2 [Colletotrichum spaethianum]|uniref:Bifunctional epoxide hydrolase 2 n=1 Tax=Colletotrichum spaethianum TaxID=700344 RepID=A0AA37UPN0_9PEZI|nr:bifunctional epoxide hydrolase 2 [Colletotrichum spaethianum]GKT51045.1 bifunctional epoxide hydrolase 2 [Colletotrichum spaethianum]
MAPPTLNENQFTHSGDKTTFYWSAGPSGGPLVIFIHGWPANGETWKPQLLTLASLGFRVIAPDNRGYGRSSVPKGPSAYALEHHVSDMLALLAHLGRDKAIWIGHDWGAGLVWGFASHHPEKCIGVCCLAVPYAVLDLETLVSLSNREIYPKDEYPFAQWDYQAFHNEQPDTSAAQLQANVSNTVKLLYQRAGPETYGKPSFLSSVRRLGGWFGGLPTAPDLPFETTLFKDDKPAFDRIVAEFERNGFEGPNDYYRNYDANKVYNAKAPNGVGSATRSCSSRRAGTALSEPMRELCEDLTEVSIEAGHWVALEKPEETNAAIVRWIATKLPTYFPGYWKAPFVSRK